jgi:hypothetical protein
MTDDTGKEIIQALNKIPGMVGSLAIDRGGTGASTKEEALRNLGAQPLIEGVDVPAELAKTVKSVNSIAPDKNGNVVISNVLTAANLTSDDAQDIYGEFIERTTGGSASLTDGKSWVGLIEGNSELRGHAEEQKSVQVTNMPREPITASVDWSVFRVAANFQSTNIIFSYDGSAWNQDLAAYGVTVSGYPIAGDTITASFTAKSESYNVTSDTDITVEIDWETYESAYASEPVTFFSYASGEWSADVTAYGITVTGVPADGDVINVYYSPEVHTMYINSATRGDVLVAYVNWDIFKAAVNYEQSTVNLQYTTNWSSSLENYGVSLSGSPIKGDQITLYYTPEIRGQIVNATPTKFVSTNWNLYNHTLGYARVLKYSDSYGFKIAGTYTTALFSETPDGATQPIAIDSNGDFDIPSDGYIIVTGGNATDTMIYMTWSDWTEGTPLEFVAYSESVIDLSGLIQATFPYGLCAVGGFADDIDFTNKTANSRIERLEYSSANLEIAKASGRDYAYDENYIYIVKATPTSVGFTINNEMDAFDHGMEFFADTVVPCFVHMLYGHNLKDKLRTDVVTISRQNLTSAQKQQVRENLGLGGSAELPVENGGTGANTAAGARTALGLGTAAVKNIAASIVNTDTGLPTAALVRQAINSEIETLDSKFGSRFSIGDNGESFSISSGSRLILDFLAQDQNACGTATVYVSESGSVAFHTIAGISGLTISTATNTVTISGSVCTMYARIYSGGIS